MLLIRGAKSRQFRAAKQRPYASELGDSEVDGLMLNRRGRADAAFTFNDRILFRLFGINPREARFTRRGFPRTAAQAHLEGIGAAFIEGYNLSLSASTPEPVLEALRARPHAFRGFFAEGATMGAAILTSCIPWRDRLSPMLAAFKEHYVHLSHVGVGWAMARLPFARPRLARLLDPQLAPLAVDGRGFHDGYFRGSSVLGERRKSGPWNAIYDQGVGRSLWFSCGADPLRIATVIAPLDPNRRDDLWAGIGLACVYAGGAGAGEIDRLIAASGESRHWLRQGAAFAISAHARSGSVPDQAAAAGSQICGLTSPELAEIVDKALAMTKSGLPQPAPYQRWRHRVSDALSVGAA